MKTPIAIFILLTILSFHGKCQKGPSRYFGQPILTDSLSTVFIPTRYNEDFFSANKITLAGDYYANIIMYDFQTDTYKKLFERDTFIEAFQYAGNYPYRTGSNEEIKNLTTRWIFLLVKNKDTNSSGRIDERGPSILFAVSLNGQHLTQLTGETENVVSFETFDKQGFILIKIQKDSDDDRSFKNEDKEYYFRKINLNDLSIGKGIEL